MKDSTQVRNVAIFGQGKSGKTSLAEALLFTAGKTNRLGKVDDGSAVMDFEPEEIQRKLSINSSFNNLSWKKNQVFVIDSPGDDNFINEARFASRITDSVIFTIDTPGGVKFQTEKIADYVAEANLPTIIFLNKMDKERADLETAVADIKENLPFEPVVLYLPIGAEADFKGVVDILNEKAYLFDHSGKIKETDIPDDLVDEIEAKREELMEQVAETDDDLIEKFLEEGELEKADLLTGLKNGVQSGALSPVIPGAATENLGTELLLNTISDLLPSPLDRPAQEGTDPKTEDLVEREPSVDAPFSALVFKTMADPYAGRLTIFRVYSGTLEGDNFYNANKETSEKFGQLFVMEGKESKPVDTLGPGMIGAVAKLKDTTTGDTLCTAAEPILYEGLTAVEPMMSFAVTPAKKEDEDKLFSSLSKMLEEDPTLKLSRGDQTNEILLAGVGQIHLLVLGERIKRKFGVEMALNPPKVPYKETLKGKARVQGKHKKQSGGRGQYADSWIEIEPLPPGSDRDFEFENKIVGGAIPRQYIPAVEKGIIEAMEKGVLAGYPMIGVKVALVDGSFHAVDSSEMAFKISGSLAFKKGALEANPVLLEPIMNLTITIPKDCVGDVIGDLNSRRGKVMGMDSVGKAEIINAQIPMAEVLEYSPDLTSITGGRGSFLVELSHYEELPAMYADKVIAAAKEEG